MSPTQVEARLRESYPGAEVTVQDLTGTQDHYQVVVISDAFNGMTRIQRHQSVMGVFDNELKSGEVHALTIKAGTQSEK